MITLNPNFYFDNTKNALAYYEEALGAETVIRVPGNEALAKQFGLAAETAENLTMHAEFKVLGIKFTATDNFRKEPLSYSGTAMMLNCMGEEAQKGFDFWDHVNETGKVTINQPLTKQAWGGYMGEFVDTFGVRWLLTINE